MIKVIGLNTKVLKKEPFSGSHHGMRFFMRAENDILHVWVYPEPWCFEQTSDDVKTLKDFPFTGEGLDESLEWISQEFEERKDYWMQMEKDKMKMILYITDRCKYIFQIFSFFVWVDHIDNTENVNI